MTTIPGMMVEPQYDWTYNELPVVYSVAVMYVGIHGAMCSSFYVRGMPLQAKHVTDMVRQCIRPPFNDSANGTVFINVWSLSDTYHELVLSPEKNVDMRSRFTVQEGFTINDNSSLHTDDPAV